MTDATCDGIPPIEAWLASSDSEKWACAMLVCDSAGAQCGADGYCHYGGRCFGDLQWEVNQQAERLREFGEILDRFVSVIEEYPVLSKLNIVTDVDLRIVDMKE